MAERHWLMQVLLVDDWAGVWLAIFGIVAQGMFMSRMLLQWIMSERARRSVVPPLFWWLSLWGGLMLLAYGILDHDVVIIFGQFFGILIYVRNLYLIHVSGSPPISLAHGPEEEAAER